MRGSRVFSNPVTYNYADNLIHVQGWIQDFLKGGSESRVDRGGANSSIVSLKLEDAILFSTKIPR